MLCFCRIVILYLKKKLMSVQSTSVNFTMLLTTNEIKEVEEIKEEEWLKRDTSQSVLCSEGKAESISLKRYRAETKALPLVELRPRGLLQG